MAESNSIDVPVALGSWRLSARLLARAHYAILFGVLYSTFVGTKIFNTSSLAERADGDGLNRLLVFSLFAVAVPVLWSYRSEVLECLRANAVLFLIAGLCLVSVVWSDYPGLTIRRGILLVLMVILLTAIVVGTTDLRRFHSILFYMLSGIVVFNLFTAVAFPGDSFSDIGFQGIYSSKNVAGTVGMIAIVVAVTWLFGCNSQREVLGGLASIGLMVLFLVLTRSKTSIGLTVVALAIGAVFLVVKRTGAGAALLVITGALAALAGLIIVLMWTDFDYFNLLQMVVGDASFTGRDELWAFAWKTAAKRPLLGYGYGAFWDVGEANDPLRVLEPGSWLGDVELGVINQAHNGYLELALHIGWPATILVTSTVIVAIWNSTGLAMRASRYSNAGPPMACAALLLLLYLLHNLTEATLFIRGAAFCNIGLLLTLLVKKTSLMATSRGTGGGH